jgi:hypothetical protein
MAGRTVTVPAIISKVVSIRSVPCINTFIMALGEGNKIVNADRVVLILTAQEVSHFSEKGI